MNRDYENGLTTDAIKLFTGIEIEHTVAFGLKTLFVVGTDYDINEIIDTATTNDCPHIYLGANATFYHSGSTEDISVWQKMIDTLIAAGFTVTLDFKAYLLPKFSELDVCNYDKFIPMISVDIPHIDQLGPNACLKIDDHDFKFSNEGVWVHQLADLQGTEQMTRWDQYKSDTPLK